MKKLILFSLCITILFSCKSDQKNNTTPSTSGQNVEKNKVDDIPALPTNMMQELLAKTTYIDYIFYSLPFSISQDNEPSINANLKLISTEALGNIPSKCQPIGREFFHFGGEIAYEAEVYFENGCYGYVFLKNEKPIYANKVSEAGFKFYTNIISQAKQIQNQASNGG